MLSRLRTLLNIYPGEGVKVIILFFYAMFMASGVYVVGRSVSRALFLSALPTEAIAYRFILPPLAIMFVAAVYSRLVGNYSLRQLIMGTTGMFIGGALSFRLLLATPIGDSFGVLAALFVFFEIIVLLATAQFWNFAGEVFDPRQAKRLYGLIGAGGTLATVVGGAGLSLLATLLAPENLIFVMILCLIGCLACVHTLSRQPAASAPAVPNVTGSLTLKSLLYDLRAMGQSPLVVTIGGLAVIMVVISTLAEYQLDLALKAAFAGDGAQISLFLGNLFFWAGLGACAVQFFVTGRVLSRFGLTAALLFSPLGFGLGAAAIFMTGGVLWAAALPRVTDIAFRTTINSVATNMLYLPTPATLRTRAKTLVQGIITPPIVIVAGLTFLVLRDVEEISPWHWSIPMLLLAAVWVMLIYRAHRLYTQTLARNLQKSRLSLDELPLNLNDDTTVGILTDALQHPDELRVIGALHMLSEATEVDWQPHLEPLLHHPAPVVRITAAKTMARLGSADQADLLLPLCRDPEAEVRPVAIEAYCALSKEEALDQIMPFLSEADPGVKRAAVVNLIRYGGLDGILPAAEHLKKMLGEEQSRMRLEGARALGELQIHTFYRPLIPLLDDPEPAVQIEAIRAAGAVRAQALTPHLIPKLGHPATRELAVEALAQLGQTVCLPLLAKTLADETVEQSIRLQLPRVLRQLGSPQAVTVLLNHFEDSDRVVRGGIFAALTRLRDAGVHFEIEKQRIHAALLLEFGYYYEVYVWQTDLAAAHLSATSLLDEALTVRLNERLDRIFFLLELLYSVQTIAAIRAVLTRNDHSQRVTAIELLDNILARNIKALLLPLIEMPPEQVAALARQRFGVSRMTRTERLGYLAGYPDPWLRCCAIFEIGRLELHRLIGPVQAALDAENDLVRETAQAVYRQLKGGVRDFIHPRKNSVSQKRQSF